MFFGCILNESKEFHLTKTNHIIHLNEACINDSADKTKAYLKIVVDETQYNLCMLQRDNTPAYKLDHFIAWGLNNKNIKLLVEGGGPNAQIHITGYIEMEDEEDNIEFVPGVYRENKDNINNFFNRVEKKRENKNVITDNKKINEKESKNSNKEIKDEIRLSKDNFVDNLIKHDKIKTEKSLEKKDSFELKLQQEKEKSQVNNIKEKEKEEKTENKKIKTKTKVEQDYDKKADYLLGFNDEKNNNNNDNNYYAPDIEYDSPDDLFYDEDGEKEDVEIGKLLQKKRKGSDSQKHPKPLKLSEVKEEKNKSFSNKNNYFNKNKNYNNNYKGNTNNFKNNNLNKDNNFNKNFGNKNNINKNENNH